MDERISAVWQAIGLYSSNICRPEAELAPPQELLDAMRALEEALTAQPEAWQTQSREGHWTSCSQEHYESLHGKPEWSATVRALGVIDHPAPDTQSVEPETLNRAKELLACQASALLPGSCTLITWDSLTDVQRSGWIERARREITAEAPAPARKPAPVVLPEDEREAFRAQFAEVPRAFYRSHRNAWLAGIEWADRQSRAQPSTREGELREWLRDNMTFFDAGGTGAALASVSKRIWYHATDDVTSYPFDEVAAAALDKAGS